MEKMKNVRFGILCIGICFIILILNGSCSGKKNISEIFIPEEYQKMCDMEQRLEIYDAWTKADPLVFNSSFNIDSLRYVPLVPPNLEIRYVFTDKEVSDVYDRNSPADKGKFAIYTLNQYLSHRRQLLLFNKGEFTAFYVDDYPKVIHKIITYFKKHKDLDERLLPLCIQEVTKIYVANRRTTDQFGPWRHWWSDDADSLGRIYNEHLRWN